MRHQVLVSLQPMSYPSPCGNLVLPRRLRRNDACTMTLRGIVQVAAAAALLAAGPETAAAKDLALAAELQAKTQKLVDAIAPGNKAPWEAATDPAFFFVTEGGEVVDRRTLLSS